MLKELYHEIYQHSKVATTNKLSETSSIHGAKIWRVFFPRSGALAKHSPNLFALHILLNHLPDFNLRSFLFKIYLYENLTGVDPRLLNTIILNYRKAFTYMACTWMVLDGNVEAVN